MPIDFSRLLPLGWSNFFSTQIPLEALDRVRPARVVRVERDRYGVDARNLLGRAPGGTQALRFGTERDSHEAKTSAPVDLRYSRNLK